ncbi:hypothetical protein OB08_07830 [Microbacterium sp. HJ5]
MGAGGDPYPAGGGRDSDAALRGQGVVHGARGPAVDQHADVEAPGVARDRLRHLLAVQPCEIAPGPRVEMRGLVRDERSHIRPRPGVHGGLRNGQGAPLAHHR